MLTGVDVVGAAVLFPAGGAACHDAGGGGLGAELTVAAPMLPRRSLKSIFGGVPVVEPAGVAATGGGGKNMAGGNGIGAPDTPAPLLL